MKLYAERPVSELLTKQDFRKRHAFTEIAGDAAHFGVVWDDFVMAHGTLFSQVRTMRAGFLTKNFGAGELFSPWH